MGGAVQATLTRDEESFQLKGVVRAKSQSTVLAEPEAG